MSDKSKIEWTDASWQPVVGCTKVSEGCQNCYAERMAHRLAYMGKEGYCHVTTKEGKWNGNVYHLFNDRLDKPLHWHKPRRIFVCSMGDLFHESVPFEFIAQVWDIMFECYQHTFQILTKRIKRAEEFCVWLKKEKFRVVEHFNIHFGVTIELPKYKHRADILRQIPAAVRFISFEPLFGDMGELNLDGIGQVIIGCESIQGKVGRLHIPEIINNPMSGVKISAENIWRGQALDIVNQCRAVNISPFVKQIPINGKVSHKMAEWPEDLQVREYPK